MGYKRWSVGAAVALGVWASATRAAAQSTAGGSVPAASADAAPQAAASSESSGVSAGSPAVPSAGGSAAPASATATMPSAAPATEGGAAPAAAPGAVPSAAPDTVVNETSANATAEIEVVVRDGAIFRGQLVEKLPGQYVTLRLSTGEYRRIRWPHIARITDGVGTTKLVPQVQIEFRADDRRATLQKRRGDGSWFNVCATPCLGAVAATGVYRVAGDGVRPSHPFRLHKRGGTVRIDADTSTRGRTVLGRVLTIGGVALAYIGLFELTLGFADDDSTAGDGGVDLAVPMFLGGLAAGITGVVMLVGNDTQVQLSAPASGQRAAGRGTSAALALQLPLGLTFTERGIVF